MWLDSGPSRFTPLLNSPQYALNISRSRRLDRENIPTPVGIRTPDHQARSLVSIPTSYRKCNTFHCPMFCHCLLKNRTKLRYVALTFYITVSYMCRRITCHHQGDKYRGIFVWVYGYRHNYNLWPQTYIPLYFSPWWWHDISRNISETQWYKMPITCMYLVRF